MVWYGMVWYGMVWYGMVWYGMVGPDQSLAIIMVGPLVSGIWYLVYCTSPIAYPIVNGYSPSGTWGPRTSTGGFGYSPSGARDPTPQPRKVKRKSFCCSVTWTLIRLVV